MTDRASRPRSGPFDLLAVARAASDGLTRFAVPLYAAVILGFVALFVAAAWFLTVEADEAWMLLSTMNAFGIPLPPTDAVASPVLTTGGLHFVIHGLLARIGSGMFAHRLVSLLFAGLLLALVYRALRWMERPRPIAVAGTALFAAVPGMILQASMATGEVIATFLWLSASIQWLRRGQYSNRQALVSGLLFGLACATRVNCVIALPALLIYALLSGAGWRSHLLRALLATVVAALVMGLAIGAYAAAARTGNASHAQHMFMVATGVAAERKSVMQLVWSFVIGDRMMPLWLIAIIGGAFVISAGERTDRAGEVQPTQLAALLLLAGIASLAAWIVQAPIPHVRYLWPAIPCLWLAGVIQLTQPAIAGQRGYRALAFHAFILAVCGSRISADSLVVANGESLTLIYQANGTAPFQLPHRSLHAARDQRALAAFLAGQPPDAQFYALITPNAYPLTLLSRRTIAPLSSMGASGPRYLIVSPADAAVWHPGAAFMQWVRASTSPAFVSGDFAAFRVNDGVPMPPDPALMRVGDNDLVNGGQIPAYHS